MYKALVQAGFGQLYREAVGGVWKRFQEGTAFASKGWWGWWWRSERI